MAIYEYRCIKCEKNFEVKRSIKEAEGNVECPYCHGVDVKRVYTTFIFNDSRRSGSSSCATCTSTTCSSCK